MASESCLIERVREALMTNDKTFLTEVSENISGEINLLKRFSQQDYCEQLGKTLRRNLGVECYIPEFAKKESLVALR